MPRFLRLPVVCRIAVMVAALSASALSAEPAGPHDAIKKYLDSQTAIVAWLQVDGVDLAATADFFAEMDFARGLPQALEQAADLHVALRQLKVERIYWIGDFAMLSLAPKTLVVPTANPQAVGLLLKSMLGDDLQMVIDGDALLLGHSAGLAFLQEQKGQCPDNLTEAMAACQGKFGLAIAPPAYLWPSLSEALPTAIPDQAISKQIASQLSSIHWLAASGDIPPNSLALRLKLSSGEAAMKLSTQLRDLVAGLLGDQAPAPWDVDDASLVFETRSRAELEQLLAEFGVQPRGKLASQRSNDLKQIALALHNYHATYKQFPPQSLVNERGERLLSWRVMILPFIEHQELYEQFHLDEPWDSPHNLKLAEQMPRVFQYSAEPQAARKTNLLAPITANSVFGRPGKPVDFSDITDGTSNTLWVVEADPSDAVVWTQPADLTVDEQMPKKSLAGEREGFYASLVDGSVHYLDARKITDATLSALLTISGREPTQPGDR